MSVSSYQWDDLDLTPEETGIYAWYMKPVLRPADLTDYQSTRNNLLLLAKQLSIPNLNVEAKGNLSLKFKGNLLHEHLAIENGEGLSQLVESILEDNLKREIFANILENAIPHLMAPLYIGVARNIRRRLSQHRHHINRFRELVLKGQKEEFENYEQKFALEVVKRGIPNGSLCVFVSTIQEKRHLEETRKIAEAVETILNRLFYPIMGRR